MTAGGINAGADGSIMSILRSMMVFQMMIVGGDSWTSPFGAAATMYEVCWFGNNEPFFATFQFLCFSLFLFYCRIHLEILSGPATSIVAATTQKQMGEKEII